MNLQTRISDVSRIYKIYARRLEKLGIRKIEDFLFHIPFRYENFSLVSKTGNVQPREVVTVKGKVTEIKNDYLRRFRTIQKAKIEDETGIIDIIWFNQPFIAKSIKVGDFVSISGKVDLDRNRPIFKSPEYEVIESLNDTNTIHTGRLVPVYPQTWGVSSKWLRRQVNKILRENKNELYEYLPYSIIENLGLESYIESIEQIHFPKDEISAKNAKKRLSFDELFLLQLSSLIKKKEWESLSSKKPFSVEKYKKQIEFFLKSLPFDLTAAQDRVVKEIFSDLSSNKPMNRLLQGEVGSGKTVVSTIAMYLSHLNGYKSILMAPTEILAQQHFNTVNNLLSPFGIKVSLITGSRNKESRIKKKHDSLFNIHDSNVYVGTHALLYQNLGIKNLGLVVIDEQQRFGVRQRAEIRKKGVNPNLLTMTATPIPRTVALTLYGNLSLSYLDEMPKGRKRVKTWLVPPVKRNNAYKWIGKQILENKDQTFIICPFIEESEGMKTVKAATAEFERLKNEVFPNLKLGLLHGKMKAKEKEDVLNKFRKGLIDILVATPVVEVGIDIPNATIMLIEEAQRFGLAQLHQLRGRVGRGDKDSYCLLFAGTTNPTSLKRLKSMETIYQGAELAELDLKLRGPGEIFGTMQHGIPELKIASFSDFDLIEKTKKSAEEIFPELNDYPKLLEKIKSIQISEVSPD